MEDRNLRTFKAVGIITWEIDLAEDIEKEDALKEAKEFLDNIVAKTPGVRTAVRIDKLKRTKSRVLRLGEFEPSEVLSKITRDDIKSKFRVGGEEYAVKLNSQRYFVFRNSLACVSCGLAGTKMVLEVYPSQDCPHFNLYAEENDELVLMTKDHIHSKAKGGQDRHSNYQTMCAICNNLKGSSHLCLEGIRKLRQVYDEHKSKVSRRAFSSLVNVVKEDYNLEHGSIQLGRKQKGVLRSSVDLHIYKRISGKFRAQSVYTKMEEGDKCVACVKAGEPLELLGLKGKSIKVKFNDTFFLLYQGLAQYGDS